MFYPLSIVSYLLTLTFIAANLEAYQRVSSKLKLGTFEDEFVRHIDSNTKKSQQSAGETDVAAQMKIGEQHGDATSYMILNDMLALS